MKWISVKDRLPKDLNDVLVKLACGTITGGFHTNNDWWPVGVDSTYDGAGICVFDEIVTHWMPLPQGSE